MSQAYQVILCTCPDLVSAEKLAGIIIENNIAACVNILPGLTSVYQWQGEIETAREHLLIIKSRADYFQRIESCILDNHPYELPEIIAVPVQQGHSKYLQWIDTCLSSK